MHEYRPTIEQIVFIEDETTKKILKTSFGDFNIKEARSINSPNQTDQLILSPAVPMSHPTVMLFRKANCHIYSEVELFQKSTLLDHYQTIAVTGTNGKSTTTVMIDHLLNSSGKTSYACGNIGTSPSEQLFKTRKNTAPVFCLELSSYQLEQVQSLKAEAVVFTNFSLDHQERHKSMDNYFRAKWRIVEMNLESILVTTSSIVDIASSLKLPLPKNVLLEDQWTKHKDIVCPFISTSHDQTNACMAIEVVSHISGLSPGELGDHLSSFKPLEHRCEHFATWEGKKFVNDSKSTNVDSTKTALDSYSEPLILILGGISKKEGFGAISKYKQVKDIYLFGQDASYIANSTKWNANVYIYQTLDEVLNDMFSKIQKNVKTVLFSPGCASFDQYKNFEQRGDFFKKEVLRRLK